MSAFQSSLRHFKLQKKVRTPKNQAQLGPVKHDNSVLFYALLKSQFPPKTAIISQFCLSVLVVFFLLAQLFEDGRGNANCLAFFRGFILQSLGVICKRFQRQSVKGSHHWRRSFLPLLLWFDGSC